MNTEWANSLLNIIPTVPFAWFGVSLVVWVLIAFILYQYSQYLQRKSTGVTTVKIRFDKKVFVDKVYELISTKARTYEDRSISTLGYEVATFTYPEYDWGPNNGVPQCVTSNFAAPSTPTPSSCRRRGSCPGMMAGGGFFFDFEWIRTASGAVPERYW